VVCAGVAVTSTFVVCRPSSQLTRVYDITGLPAPLRTPRGLMPDDGAAVGASAALAWRSSPGARSYTLEYARTPDLLGTGAALVREEGLVDTTFTIAGLPPNATFYWRVWAEAEGNGSAWSPVRSFTTFAAPPAAAPALVAPADQSMQAPAVSLDWTDVPDTERYRVQVALADDFADLVVDTDVTAPISRYVTPLLERVRRYHWRVRAANGAGDGPWSAVRRFDVRPLLPTATPLLLAPDDGATGVGLQPTLTWTSVEWATTYDVQLAHNATFSPLVVEATSPDTLFTPAALQVNRLHYWRTRGVNSEGVGPWSAARTFVTSATVSTGDDGLPSEFAMSAPRPNPARDAVTLELSLPAASRVRIAAYDALGREVALVRADDVLSAGRHVVGWSADVPSGVYVLRADVWPSGGAAVHTFTRRVAVAR
jgi:hypothetical protein